MHWLVESSINIWFAERFLEASKSAIVDQELTELHARLKEYLLSRKQRSDLLRLTIKSLGDALVKSANHKIDGRPAPLVDTEVCFDPANPFCSPVNLPWFPATADWIAEVDKIDEQEPWRNWWLTTPGLHPYNTIFRPANPGFPLFVPNGADPSIVSATVMEEAPVYEPAPPALHPRTKIPLNRPGLASFSPPNRPPGAA
ncbi:unnamed protein product [Phytophthora lilii]|uniref:Unnamed protein product n=1 Tax=Phytophthora lilii TaxID=2077276 RepID=A0A9W7D9Y1_9STRA|nr:unnamed protein product [Phytophthora lilii]